MPTPHFYLKKKDGKPLKSLIYLQFKYAGEKFVYAFGQRIDPKNWNKSTERVKSNKVTTADGQYSLNDLLDSLAKACVKGYNIEMAKGTPAKEKIKGYLDVIVNQNAKTESTEKLFTLFDRFTSGEIKSKGRKKSENTIKNYVTTKAHLLSFDNKTKYRVNFDNINLDFFYKFTTFLEQEKGLQANSIAKYITVLKVVLGEAVDLGYTTNMQFKNKKFNIAKEETDSVYLNEKEVQKIYKHDFSKNIKLEQVRDLFVFGCYVGLRFSDYSDIKEDNIVTEDGEFFIKLITKKTGELVIIPCNPVVLEIFKKYDHNKNRLPKAISNQKFNDYIKDVCKEVKLTERGRLSTDPTKELWECISSHTARRSFATNLYLQGFPTIDLMKITGHKTEKAFLSYIRVSKLDTAKRLSAHIKEWTAKIMKVAS